MSVQNRSASRLRIDVCTASNEVPKYADCAPWFIRFWHSAAATARHDYLPVVVDVRPLDDSQGVQVSWPEQSIRIEEPGLSTAFTAQCVRLLAPAMMRGDLVVISDVDMFPLTSRVFDLAVNRMNESGADLCVVRDVLGRGQFPMCYIIASPRTWQRLFPDPMDQALRKWWQSVRETGYEGHNGPNWCFDQLTLYATITAAESAGALKVLRLKDHMTGHRRLDRIKHAPRLGRFMRWLVHRGAFTDYHTHFPVEAHRSYFEGLLEAIDSRTE